MKNKQLKSMKSGFAAVTLIVFMAIAITITTAATTMIIVNNMAASQSARSLQAYYLAESGMEEGLINYLRNPNYIGTSGYIDMGEGTVNVSITGGTMVSTAEVAGFERTLNAQLNYNGTLTVSSWKEVF
jgi:hypothetical protein